MTAKCTPQNAGETAEVRRELLLALAATTFGEPSEIDTASSRSPLLTPPRTTRRDASSTHQIPVSRLLECLIFIISLGCILVHLAYASKLHEIVSVAVFNPGRGECWSIDSLPFHLIKRKAQSCRALMRFVRNSWASFHEECAKGTTSSVFAIC